MKNLKKLSRKEMKFVQGGRACSPSNGINCPGTTICCALSYDNLDSGMCRSAGTTCLAPNP